MGGKVHAERGQDVVKKICGKTRAGCTIALGDWNAPIKKGPLNHTVVDLWRELVNGSGPTAAAPDENTCCYPETKYHGADDHVVTNIAGAEVAGSLVFPYQIMS